MRKPNWMKTMLSWLPEPGQRFLSVLEQSRLFGLAAESAFWITFTLPWIALGVISSVGFIASRSDPAALAAFQESVLSAASKVLTPEAVDTFIKPMLDQLSTGRADLTLLGVVIALWSGSRMVAAFTESVAVIHGRPRHHGYARNRGLGLLVYTIGLIGAGIAVALMAVGPDRMSSSGGAAGSIATYVVVGVFTWAIIVLLFQMGSPVRPLLRYDMLGAVVALAGWLIGSFGLQYYTDHLFGEFSVYSAVAAPIAILLWSYITAIAVLLGVAVSVVLEAEARIRRDGPESQPTEVAPTAR